MVLCASASKTSDGVLQSFYYKNKGRGSLYSGECNYEKWNEYRWTNWVYSITWYVKYRTRGELWLGESMNELRWSVYRMDGMRWFRSRMPRAGISKNGINSGRQAAFTALLGRPKYQSIGVITNTQLCLCDDADDLKRWDVHRMNGVEWYDFRWHRGKCWDEKYRYTNRFAKRSFTAIYIQLMARRMFTISSQSAFLQ